MATKRSGKQTGAVRISVSDAKARLTDLVRRAEAGADVVLTRHGQAAVRLVPVRTKPLDVEARRALIASIQSAVAAKVKPGPDAARSQDFLYDEYGLPK
jgi:prevent-host-death family protein